MSNSAVKSKIKFPFSNEEVQSILNEGWGLSEVSYAEQKFEIQHLGDGDAFSTDDQAWEYVILKAVNGSELHQRVIKFIKDTSGKEFSEYVHDVHIKCTEELSKEFANEFSKPWGLYFSNGEAVGFDTEDDALSAQSYYRKSVSLSEMTI
jgi:hypothetical protein